MIFNIDSAIKHSYLNDDIYFSIDVIDEILKEDFDALLDEGSKILHSIEGTVLEEEIFFEFDKFIAMVSNENYDFESDTEEPPFEKITINTDYKIKTSLEEPLTELELKPLLDNLKYVFLEDPSFLSVIISSQLSAQNKSKLVYVLKKHKESFSWKTTDIHGICPSFCKHKIQLLDDKKPVVQKQRSPWVSRIHCVPEERGGYFQIPMDPNDQEKTTFTCPFGTYAYRRMPFRLCNTPATFQRCMLAIFHDMIEESVEEKCHFMVKEGIALGHKVSGAGLEIDKAKINVISKLSPPTNIKAQTVILRLKLLMCDASDFAIGAVLAKSVNESLNLSYEELYKARALAEATLRERDEMINAQFHDTQDNSKKDLILSLQTQLKETAELVVRFSDEKDCALKEIERLKDEIKSFQIENQDLKSRESELNNLEKVYETKESVLLKDIDQIKSQVSKLLEKLKISDQEIKQQIILFEEDKQMFLAKNEFLKKVSSSVQKEYNDLLASNYALTQRLKTKFRFLKHNNSLEKMFEMIEQEYESNISKISIISSTIETKNLELAKEMGDKVKRFDDKKKVFENKISKMEKVLAQRVKDFNDVKTELSKRIDKFETYFANLEKENALVKSQLASQNYTSLQKENNDLRTSCNVLKEKHETSCEKT
ncbi:hypothetical protein Tco_1164487 [Tanacetum coccineum]